MGFVTMLLQVFFLISLLVPGSRNCGSLTHMEIANRATDFFNMTFQGVDIRQLMLKYPDALQTGAVFPDSFYSGACFCGIYHEISETTHWMHFIQTALDYFNKKYEIEPIDEEGEKLLVFILGIISHDIADVLWHSLGIDQGFIDTMAKLNFHGNYQAAHTVADPGGDSVILYEFGPGNCKKLRWFVPIADLLSIYSAIGVDFNATIIKTCAIDLMEVETAAELEIFEQLYSSFVAKSPFLGSSRFTDYFLGGLNEMVAWTVRRWETALMYLESNGENCTNTEKGGANPFYWVCGLQPPIKPPPPSANIHARPIRKTTSLLPTESIFTASGSNKPPPRRRVCRISSYFLKKPYSMLGQALLSIDLNGDKYDDLIIGAPGLSSEGRVFVVLGSSAGLRPESGDLDLEKMANFAITPPPTTISGRFGFSVASLDFNGDSLLDLVISDPLYSQDAVNKLYSGRVFIYYGTDNESSFPSQPDVVIDCEMRFCNFGWSLSTGDVNGDNKADLIIGAPYASQSESMRQNGLVSVFFSGSHHTKQVLTREDADLLLWGMKEYSWFGYSAIVTPFCTLLIGAPAEQVASNNGTLLQMSGTVYCYDWTTRKMEKFAKGVNEFANFGSALSFGFPNGKHSTPLIAISAPNDDNFGKYFGIIPISLKQSGSVYFYSSTSIGKFAGERHFGTFGHFIQFIDANNDGFDDLFVGAPMRRQSDSGGEPVGELFVFYGSENFPPIGKKCKGDVNPCPEEQADLIFSIETFRTQFGSNAAISHFVGANFVEIAISAQNSNQYGTQAGKLTVFHCNYSSSSLGLCFASPLTV